MHITCCKYAPLPVLSVIVYPFRTTIAVSPFEEISDGEVILSFKYRTLALWLQDAVHYVQKHEIAMYALLPAMSGVDARLLDQAIEEMLEYYKDDQVTLARDLRWMGIILRRTDEVLEEDKQVIQERLSMYDDLMENDPEMQRLRAKYEAEGLAKGIAEGLAKAEAREAKAEAKAEAREAKAKITTLREIILTLVKVRFPSLKKQARQRIKDTKDADELLDLFEQLVGVSDEATASAIFTASQSS